MKIIKNMGNGWWMEDGEKKMKIRIKIGKVEIFATLKETATAGKVLKWKKDL